MLSAPNLLADFLTYLQENLIFFIIIAVCIVAIVVILVILAVSGKKAKKKMEIAAQPDEESTAEKASNEETSPEEKATGNDPATAISDSAVTDNAEDEETLPVAEDTAMPDKTSAEVPDTNEDESEASGNTENELEDTDVISDEPEVTDAISDEPDEGTSSPDESEQNAIAGEAPATLDAATSENIAVIPDAENEKPAAEDAKPSTAKPYGTYSGKWVITEVVVVNESTEEEVDNAFFFQLVASNGVSLITSEDYTTKAGAEQGIETFKGNIASGNFKISISKKGKFIVKLMNSQGNLLTQGEMYSTRAQAQSAILSIQRFAESAVLGDDLKIEVIPLVKESPETDNTYDPSKKGRWIIRRTKLESENDGVYIFELLASNGQILLTSEEYASASSLKNGIQAVKKNILNGNIRAVVTRSGDYMIKIYSATGQLLCLGGHYPSRQLCQNAIESVRRFAESAPLNLDKIIIQ